MYVFNISTENGQKFFLMDLKNELGKIDEGDSSLKGNITVSVKDADFVKIAKGELKSQSAFMKGLVKVKGAMSLAMKLDQVIKALSSKAKL